jgi:V8-like Glu-specific endopeptidase
MEIIRAMDQSFQFFEWWVWIFRGRLSVIKNSLITFFFIAALTAPAYASEQLPVGRLITLSGPNCSATLIGPSKILTAAHCVVNRSKTGLWSPSLIQFSITSQDGLRGYAKAVSVGLPSEYALGLPLAVKSLASDWAILKLDKELGRIFGIVEVLTAPEQAAWISGTVKIVAYGRAKVSRPNFHGTCHAKRTGNLIEHDCQIEKGGSGAALITEDGRIVGVNVAKRQVGASRPIGIASFPQYDREFLTKR